MPPPPLQLTSVAQALFQRIVGSANLISPYAAASPQSVVAELEGARVWQFWTHGRFDQADATRSGLQLAGRTADGQAVDLTVGDLLAAQFGDSAPDLVILSACETGLPDIKRNDELIGLPVALIQAGTRGVITAMWPVQEDATALLMARFHELRINDAQPASLALWHAQKWLRTATTADLLDYINTHVGNVSPGTAVAQALDRMVSELENHGDDERPYADPYFWAGFVFMGSDGFTN